MQGKMRHGNLRQTALVTLLGATALFIGSAAAEAGTTTLICTSSDETNVEDEATTIQLNEAQSTVIAHYASFHLRPGTDMIQGPTHPQVVGPLPAVFGADTITFTYTMEGYAFDGTINRLTGAFSLNAGAINKWTCQPGQKQF